jgi:hypothetical protein
LNIIFRDAEGSGILGGSPPLIVEHFTGRISALALEIEDEPFLALIFDSSLGYL